MLRIALLIASSAVAVPAQAQGQRVVVSRASLPDVELGRAAAAALAAQLSARGAPARVPVAPDGPDALAPEIDRAGVAYANLDPSGAAERLDLVLRVAGESGGGGLSRPELLRALLLRAMSALAIGDAAAAAVALERALAIDPELSPDPVEYPPTLRAALEARRPAEDVRHALVLRGALEESRLWIDGAVANGNEHLLAPGVHLVRVEAPARAPWTAEIDLRSDHVVDVDPPFDPEAALATPGLDRRQVEEAARELDVTVVRLDVTGGIDGWTLRAEDDTTGRTVRAAIGSRDELERAAGELAAGLLSTPGATSPVRARADREREDGAPSAWPWLAAGGAILVTAAAVLLVVLSSLDQEGGRWSR